MTKEELEHDHIKKIAVNYVNECWGSFADLSGIDLVMAGIGVAKIISKEKEKWIAELEEKISILLSCKNCPENKGGFICQKEYEGKCLAQKIQFIKELQQENAELKNKLEHRNCLDCSNHSSKLRMRTLELEKECAKAKELLKRYVPYRQITDSKAYKDLAEETEQFLNSEVEN